MTFDTFARRVTIGLLVLVTLTTSIFLIIHQAQSAWASWSLRTDRLAMTRAVEDRLNAAMNSRRPVDIYVSSMEALQEYLDAPLYTAGTLTSSRVEPETGDRVRFTFAWQGQEREWNQVLGALSTALPSAGLEQFSLETAQTGLLQTSGVLVVTWEATS